MRTNHDTDKSWNGMQCHTIFFFQPGNGNGSPTPDTRILVSRITEGSLPERAGMKIQDQIIKVSYSLFWGCCSRKKYKVCLHLLIQFSRKKWILELILSREKTTVTNVISQRIYIHFWISEKNTRSILLISWSEQNNPINWNNQPYNMYEIILMIRTTDHQNN